MALVRIFLEHHRKYYKYGVEKILKIFLDLFGGYLKSLYLCIRFRGGDAPSASGKEFYERMSDRDRQPLY